MARVWCGVIVAGVFIATGCDQTTADRKPGEVTSQDVRRDASQAIQTTAEYTRQAKDEFQRNLEARLKELEPQIAKLREKGRELKDEAKVDWDRKMAELEAKRDVARAKLHELSQSGEEAWKDVQKGAESAWAELSKAFDDASQKF